MTHLIETKNLMLREFKATDVANIYKLDSNEEVHKYLGKKPITTLKEAEEIVSFFHLQYQERGIGRWAAIEKATGAFIGWSGLRLNQEYNMNGFTNYYDVGYRLIPKYWGKGYATESGKAAIDYAFKILRLPEVYATAEINNQSSHNALLKIGLNYVEDFYFEEEQLNLRWYIIKNSLL